MEANRTNDELDGGPLKHESSLGFQQIHWDQERTDRLLDHGQERRDAEEKAGETQRRIAE